MKKGFTLIELLAVLVLLAIIALITVPVVITVIGESKKRSDNISIEHYIDAVNAELANQQLLGQYEIIDGIYKISSNGKKLTKNSDTVLRLNYNGVSLTEGYVIVQGGEVKQLNQAKVDELYAKKKNGLIKYIKEEESNEMISGSDFNTKIVEFVGANTNIINMGFYPYGLLPEGYTIESLKSLPSIDLSLNDNNSISAYYDSSNGGVYVYSNDKIEFKDNTVNMFRDFSNLKTLDIKYVDTSKVTNISSMFLNCSSLEILDVSNFDTSNVTGQGMGSVFSGCTSLRQINGLTSWNTENVTDMRHMFANCRSLTSLDLSSFDTIGVIMSATFSVTDSLTCIKVGENWEYIDPEYSKDISSIVTTDSCPVN